VLICYCLYSGLPGYSMFLNVIGRSLNYARTQMFNVNSTHCVRVNSLRQTNDFFQRHLSVGVNCWNHYKLLGVGHNATKKEIKAAFIEKCQVYHPDRNPGMHEKFVAIQEAYETLGSPHKRSEYDQTVGIRPVRHHQHNYHNSTRYDRSYYGHNRTRGARDDFNYQQYQDKYGYRSRAAKTVHNDPLKQYWDFVYQGKHNSPNRTAAGQYRDNSDLIAITALCGLCMLYVISKVQSAREYDKRMLLRQEFANQQAAKELRAKERAMAIENKRRAAQEMERLQQTSFVTQDQSCETESRVPNQKQDYKSEKKTSDQELTPKTETKTLIKEKRTDKEHVHKEVEETTSQKQTFYKMDVETSDQELPGMLVFKKTDPDMSPL